MIPPLLIRIRIEEKGKKQLGLWLPLFLLWILVLPLALLVLPFFLLFACFRAGARNGFRACGAFYGLFCSLRGLHVDVESPNQLVKVFIH